MADSPENEAAGSSASFAKQAEQKSPGLLREFWDFLRHNKKWWLIPVVLMLLLVAVVLILAGSSSPLAPLIYPLF